MSSTTYHTIGIMSGSSLDGIDLVYVRFDYDDGQWNYQIKAAECIPYSHKWILRLKKLFKQDALTFAKTHTFYGHYIGQLVNKFIDKHNLSKDEINAIASHGHTLFHEPENRLTFQIGDGAAIAAVTGLPVITNFRNTDVALNGEGAPLVPVGDKHLFAGHRFCLNLGGIANISAKANDGEMIGFDTSPCNLVLNKLAGFLDLPYDDKGEIAEQGELDKELLNELNNVSYYQKTYPKSLGNHFVYRTLLPIVYRHYGSLENKLRTCTEHIALQITRAIEMMSEQESFNSLADDSMLITGGGAYNTFLVNRINDLTPVNIVVADHQTIEYKEALIFAFAGVLRLREEVNCLSSVTGADKSSVGGCIYVG